MSPVARQPALDEDAVAAGGCVPAAFRLEDVRGLPVVVATGEIDICSAQALRETLLTAQAASERVILDLRGVSFLDSTGIGVMVAASRAATTRRSLGLVGPVPMVRKVLDLTGVSELFTIHESVDEAVAGAG
jgi:anti-sigma B factor antagonist